LLDDPVLFFEEIHLVEEHVSPLVSPHKGVIEDLPVPQELGLVEQLFHFPEKDIVLDLFAKEAPDNFSDSLELEALLKLPLDLLTELFLDTFPNVEVIYFLEEA